MLHLLFKLNFIFLINFFFYSNQGKELEKLVTSVKNNGLKNPGAWLGLSMNTTPSAIQQQIGHYLNVRYYGNFRF